MADNPKKYPVFGAGFFEVTKVGQKVDRNHPPKMASSTVRAIHARHDRREKR